MSLKVTLQDLIRRNTLSYFLKTVAVSYNFLIQKRDDI